MLSCNDIIYILIATYGCHLSEAETLNCKVMWYTITKVICGISVFAGAFLAIFGHRYYLLSQLLFGSYGIGTIAFIAIVVVHHGILVNYTEQVGLSIAIGIIGNQKFYKIWTKSLML